MEVLSMEFSGEELELVGSNDNHNMSVITTKKKRTKRPRPPSPVVTSASSSGGGGDQFSVSSTMSSSEDDVHFLDEESATEEEDMAKCLILLAQGGSRKNKRKNDDGIDGTNLSVYECRTCNRRFPSFQALGGHRASHKKPKTAAAEDKTLSPAAAESAAEEGGKHKKIATLNSLSLHFGGNNNKSSSIATKVHECSICGLEFPSGQALGGHMRRHRANMMAAATAIATESPAVEEKPPRRTILSLDLNLPAPEDDHSIRDLTFHHFATTPTLVHCHY